MNAQPNMGSNQGVKIIKRYQNRKLYDTQQSCYVTLDDIARMIRLNDEVVVVDNKTKRDITAATLTQIIFEAEKKAGEFSPLSTLREIIRNQNGSFSSFLSKLGVFPASARETIKDLPVLEVTAKTDSSPSASYDDLKAALDKRLGVDSAKDAKSNPATASSYSDDDVTPELPNSNQNFNN